MPLQKSVSPNVPEAGPVLPSQGGSGIIAESQDGRRTDWVITPKSE